jgi:hypothetical protein
MKKIILLLTTILFFSCGQSNEESKETSIKEQNKDHIAVYDFHTTHRCETCLAIEKATKETLTKNFKSQVDDQIITFTLINADAEENQNIAEEYEAFGTTLAITIIKNGEKEIIDITNWAFDAVQGDDFEAELTEKLNDALGKL